MESDQEVADMIAPYSDEAIPVQPLEGKKWESAHFPILLLGIIGVAELAAVMGAIFILGPLWARL